MLKSLMMHPREYHIHVFLVYMFRWNLFDSLNCLAHPDTRKTQKLLTTSYVCMRKISIRIFATGLVHYSSI